VPGLEERGARQSVGPTDTTERDGEAREGRSMPMEEPAGRPFAVFALLFAVLLFILSLGFAFAPRLGQPLEVRALSQVDRGDQPAVETDVRPTVGGVGAQSARCVGPGCGATPVPMETPRPPVGQTPAAVEPSPVAITVSGAPSPATVQVPASLAGEPAVQEIVTAYLRAFDARAAAFAAGDPTRLAGVLGEPQLGRTVLRLTALRAEGRALRFEGGHRLALVSLDGDTARLFDEYTERLVEPASRTGRDPSTGVTRVRVVVTLRRIDVGWIVVESADASSQIGRRRARSGSDAGSMLVHRLVRQWGGMQPDQPWQFLYGIR